MLLLSSHPDCVCLAFFFFLISSLCADLGAELCFPCILYAMLRVFHSFFSSCIENISAAISYFYAVDQPLSLSITNLFLMYLIFFHDTKPMKGRDTASSAHFYYHAFENIHPVESIRLIT